MGPLHGARASPGIAAGFQEGPSGEEAFQEKEVEAAWPFQTQPWKSWRRHFCHIALVTDGSLRPSRVKGTGIWWESSKVTWQKNIMDKKYYCRCPWKRPASMADRHSRHTWGRLNSQRLLSIYIKHWAQQFACKNTFHPHSSSLRQLRSLCSYKNGGNRDSERASNLPKVTQLDCTPPLKGSQTGHPCDI